MLVLALAQRLDGTDVADACGHRAPSRNSATMALARKLMASVCKQIEAGGLGM